MKQLTNAQRRGLLAFNYRGTKARRLQHPSAFESNKTDGNCHLVYWQTLRTLAALGLVRRSDDWRPYHQLYELTGRGQLARDIIADDFEASIEVVVA